MPLSLAGLSPGVQWLWPLAAGWWHEQKVSDIHCQRGRQAVKKIDRRVKFQALDFAYRTAINFGFKAEVFLTDTLCGTKTSKIPSNAAASIHVMDATNLLATNLSDIADILDKYAVRLATTRRHVRHLKRDLGNVNDNSGSANVFRMANRVALNVHRS